MHLGVDLPQAGGEGGEPHLGTAQSHQGGERGGTSATSFNCNGIHSIEASVMLGRFYEK